MPTEFVPYYAQIMKDIRERVADGRLRPGQKLPSTRELVAQYAHLGAEGSVSPGTVRKAVEELIAADVLVGHQGVGVFVADRLP